MTKAEQKHLTRAMTQGRGAYLHALAMAHRAGSKRTQKEIELAIEEANAWDEFTMVNGALLYNSEI